MAAGVSEVAILWRSGAGSRGMLITAALVAAVSAAVAGVRLDAGEVATVAEVALPLHDGRKCRGTGL